MSGFSNPIVGGGGALVYPSIHSPGYVPGLSGWTVNKDGSVEFNNGTFRGTITNTGIYIYSGVPASGNLVESLGITAAGMDPAGLNAVLPGDTRYHNNGAGVFVAQQSSQSYIGYLWQAASALGSSAMAVSVGFTNQRVGGVAGPPNSR